MSDKYNQGGIELSTTESLRGDQDAQTLDQGEVLFREGSKPQLFYIVHRGKIGLFKKSKDRVFLIDIAEEGDFLGEKQLFEDIPMEYSAVALEYTEVLKSDLGSMKQILKDCPEWVSDLFKTIMDRLSGSLELLDEHHITDDRINKKIPISKDQEERIKKNIMGR